MEAFASATLAMAGVYVFCMGMAYRALNRIERSMKGGRK